LGGGDRIYVIPNGFDRPQSDPQPIPSTDPPRIGFIGLCTYAPNADGVRWFLDECWPIIRQELPGVRFRLAGKGSKDLVRSSDQAVDALGWLAEPALEIASWSAMAIPLRFGGGTRIKIADAFSRKCPVVSTRLGAFGYEVEDGRQVRLADSPEDFARVCVQLILDRSEAAAMAERAWKEFLEKWTWDAIAPKVWAAAEDCLRRSAGSPAK
jgi:glycosyltransferase involved in cell wall biosynthesis